VSKSAKLTGASALGTVPGMDVPERIFRRFVVFGGMRGVRQGDNFIRAWGAPSK